MKLSDQEFKALQKYWYDRAKESGFHDIEPEIKSDLSHLYRDKTQLEIVTKQEYYTLLNHWVYDENTQFRNEFDKHIMRLYAEGARIKSIIEHLNSLGKDCGRQAIRLIIRRYEMKWKIRYYTRKQLNLK